MMDKEMDVLLSEKDVKVGDKQVVVKRIALLDTLKIASKISDIVSNVVNGSNNFDTSLAKVLFSGKTKDEDGNDIVLEDTQLNVIRIQGVMEIVGIIGDDAIELIRTIIAKSTNLSYEEVDELDSVYGIDLLEAIFEVNKSFFEKCMSKLKRLTTKEKPKKAKSK